MRLAPNRYPRQELTILRLPLAPVEISDEESGGDSIPFDTDKKNATNEVMGRTDDDNSVDESDEEDEDV